jgi:formamidase
MLLSAAPCEGRINNIVDVPNSCCSIGIPAEIFDFDILPRAGGLIQGAKGRGNPAGTK